MTISRRDFVIASTTLLAAAGVSRRAHAGGSGEPDVIVIGAGLSGLGTALALEEAGLQVLVLEGRERVGGRLYTLDDVPGHPEAGGNSVASAYGRVIAAGKKYGVELENIFARAFGHGPQELFIDGSHVPLADWPRHPRNPFPDALKSLPPWGFADAVFKRFMPFKDLGRWFDPEFAQFDIPVYEFLASNGASDAAIQLAYDTNISYGTTAHDVSLLMQAAVAQWQLVNRGAGGPPFIGAFKGGNQRLPEAMARHLKGDLRKGQRVVAIESRPDGAQVACEDGSRHRAKAVVCSMPLRRCVMSRSIRCRRRSRTPPSARSATSRSRRCMSCRRRSSGRATGSIRRCGRTASRARFTRSASARTPMKS